ncbi:PepSY-associated TM helix domain-containing protein [Variovorax ginsengisoli]|uniref:PepSY-associated TM helix domain-containing protein n=1 Tax=Variovorax ginsengisoli TaxID=363844 RepID=A0ABT8S0Q2_9BURK|nr:PepSY-associated TM helix domain-containing protein [Variovorax ginsengisoli]MDN8611761.1 PepSY-associated TM helix domain-containing protein [Variovorax ginsengisoli]MDO1530931.1 PepSY-associated TM helix domain-containing protein [Variovorax ginsengisoli]
MNTSSNALAAGGRVQALQRRATAVQWIRKTHGWIGLWGAILGLLFGTAGIWLNHRAVLKLPMAQQRASAQLALPEPPPASAAEMAVWLQAALDQDRPPNSVRTEPARPVAWGEKGKPDTLMQPERWTFNFGGPDAIVQADYWRGNRSVGVTTTQNGFVATLTNMHKGAGMSVGWILLVDTLAGSLIFLSISGVILWMLTHRRRAVGLAIFGTSVALTLGLALAQV